MRCYAHSFHHNALQSFCDATVDQRRSLCLPTHCINKLCASLFVLAIIIIIITSFSFICWFESHLTYVRQCMEGTYCTWLRVVVSSENLRRCGRRMNARISRNQGFALNNTHTHTQMAHRITTTKQHIHIERALKCFCVVWFCTNNKKTNQPTTPKKTTSCWLL